MRPLEALITGESATIAKQMTDMPPWRIWPETSVKEARPKLARIRVPAWLWMSAAVPSVCAIAVVGKQNKGLAASTARRDRPDTGSAACS